MVAADPASEEMNKTEIAEIFEEIGALLELKGDNPFRVGAYYNAARMVDGLPEDDP